MFLLFTSMAQFNHAGILSKVKQVEFLVYELMEELLKYAQIAWNPMKAIEYQLSKDNLRPMPILITYLAVVIGCNLAVQSAQKFFMESITYALSVENTFASNPLVKNTFLQQFLSSIGIILPALTMYLLPERILQPYGRSATISALVVLAASGAFYGAVFGIPAHLFAGIAAASNPELGLKLYYIFGIAASICVLILIVIFWFRSFRILQLSIGTIFLIAALIIISEVIIMVFLFALLSNFFQESF